MQVIFILYTIQDDTLSSFGQGTTSGLPCDPKKQCRRSASLLFWVKFIHTLGVSSSCDMVGMCTGISVTFCSSGSPSLFPASPTGFVHKGLDSAGPSEGASLMHTHSSKQAFFRVSSIGIYSERFDFCGLSLLSCCQVLVWHHCHRVFTGCSASKQRSLPFFPPGCTFLVATTIASFLCHPVRVTPAIAVGSVAKVASRYLMPHLRCSTPHSDFPPNANDLLSVRSCCLANVLPASRVPSSRPDTASFRSCLLPPGFLGTQEAGICARRRACFPVLSSRFSCSC